MRAYLKRVKRGEEVQVFEHDHLVARLVPAEQTVNTIEIGVAARGGPEEWSKCKWGPVLKSQDALAHFLDERHRERVK